MLHFHSPACGKGGGGGTAAAGGGEGIIIITRAQPYCSTRHGRAGCKVAPWRCRREPVKGRCPLLRACSSWRGAGGGGTQRGRLPPAGMGRQGAARAGTPGPRPAGNPPAPNPTDWPGAFQQGDGNACSTQRTQRPCPNRLTFWAQEPLSHTGSVRPAAVMMPSAAGQQEDKTSGRQAEATATTTGLAPTWGRVCAAAAAAALCVAGWGEWGDGGWWQQCVAAEPRVHAKVRHSGTAAQQPLRGRAGQGHTSAGRRGSGQCEPYACAAAAGTWRPRGPRPARGGAGACRCTGGSPPPAAGSWVLAGLCARLPLTPPHPTRGRGRGRSTALGWGHRPLALPAKLLLPLFGPASLQPSRARLTGACPAATRSARANPRQRAVAGCARTPYATRSMRPSTAPAPCRARGGAATAARPAAAAAAAG